MTSVADVAATSTRPRPGRIGLGLGALGVVYGDLLTSPLYSLRDAFRNDQHPLAVDRANVLGAMSIVVWTLVILVALKYVTLVMRADNDGEGGILALTALIAPHNRSGNRGRVLVLLGLFGTALLYGDGMITPSISVLSAVEGLEVVDDGLRPLVIPIAVAVLVGLFSIQRYGTLRVGRLFGPVLLVWLVTTAVLGATSLAAHPEILQAVNPVNAVHHFRRNGFAALYSMGSLFLVVTGAEALYADMGHLGRRPITSVWWTLVMPALLLTYLGIGANLLEHPQDVRSPVFLLAPDALRLPVVLLATAATVIASQSLISGVFSITYQATKFGYAPTTRVSYTSPSTRGQVYLPGTNWVLMIACVALVLVFRSSHGLAAAMGLSVTGTMLITTILFATYARRVWRWSRLRVIAFATVVIAAEGTFLIANLFKIPHGGWFTIAVAGVVFTLMTTWKTGRRLIKVGAGAGRLSVATFAEQLEADPDRKITRTTGTAVYLFSQGGFVPPGLLTQIRATRTLHEVVHIVTVSTEDRPVVLPVQRVTSHTHAAGITDVVLRYGFMEEPTVARDLEQHLSVRPETTYYFVGRETVKAEGRLAMARWREALFTVMNRNAADVSQFFDLPPDRVIELGQRIRI